MAEKERLTKKERREQSRAERQRKEAERARQARKQRLVTGLTGALVVAAIGAVVFSAVGGDDAEIEDAILISTEAAEQARETAGCEVVDETALPDTTHHDPQSAPPADQLYTGVRPTHSGPHYGNAHPVVSGATDSQLDERATTHNLEHGAVIAWFDPEQVGGDAVGQMDAWGERLNSSGFSGDAGGMGGGAAVFVTPYTDPGISSGKAVAFRAWGVAMDCDEWNETVANSFVIDHFGTHGAAPEAQNFAPYPEGVLAYGDPESGETEEPAEDPSPAGDG